MVAPSVIIQPDSTPITNKMVVIMEELPLLSLIYKLFVVGLSLSGNSSALSGSSVELRFIFDFLRFGISVLESIANLCLWGHKSSSITSQVRTFLSSGDAQFSVSLCLNSDQASPKAEHSHFHGFPDRSVTAAVCFNHLSDAASSESRRFELTFSDTSSYVGSEVPEFVLDGKYNSKVKNHILF